MSIERLSGGLTPADGSDPRTFPEIFNGFADEFEGKNIPAFGTATPSDGDALVYNDAEGVYEPGEGGAGSLEDLTDTDISTPVAGEKLVYDGTEWVNLEAYAFVETVTFESSGTFSKGDYPWLRAIKVTAVGGGGGGGGAFDINSIRRSGAGGGGGAYAKTFIADIDSLNTNVTVTVGAGGVGGSDTPTAGNDGGDTSFGSFVSCGGGGGGQPSNGSFQSQNKGEVLIPGNEINIDGGGGAPRNSNNAIGGGFGGLSVLGVITWSQINTGVARYPGNDGSGFGAGGGGAMADDSDHAGGNGAPGILIAELYA